MLFVERIAGPLALLALLSVPALAQTSAGAVRGTLLDAATGQPVPFASVVLLHLPDSTVVADAQTTEAGVFALEKLRLGAYVLRANVLGYRVGRRALSLTTAAPVAQLGSLRLRPAATQLTEVVVQGERPPITTDLDKRVVNVAKDLTAVGGTATDVLQNVPSVAVDQTGAVSLRGKAGVTIFIDGKPTGAAGGAGGGSLDQIPASSIDRIEVITNPSARYDAAGSAGIINIILKKNQRDGLNGVVAGGVGTRDKYNTSLTLNYRKGKLNLFGSYDFRRDQRFTNGSLDQTTTGPVLDPATGQPTADSHTLYLRQSRDGLSTQISHAVRLGLEYALPHDQTLTLAAQPRFNIYQNDEAILSRQQDQTLSQPVYVGSSDRQNASLGHNNSADFTLDYRRVWPAKPGRELTAGAVYTPLSADNALAADLRYLGDGARATQQQVFHTYLHQGAAQVDFTQPLGEKGRFETGLKSIWQRSDNRYDFSSTSPALTQQSVFLYQEYVQAAYASLGGELGKLHYQGGLRLEQTNTHGLQQQTGAEFSRSYLNLFPSGTLAYDLPREQQLQLSYSRRVQRPNQGELNPFLDRSDPLNLRAGNPALLPEYEGQTELGYQKGFANKASVAVTGFYSLETQTITSFRQVISDPLTGNQVTSTSRLNIGQETNYGLELVGSLPLAAWWKVSGTASAFRRLVRTTLLASDYTNSNIVGTARLNSTFTPAKKFDIQVSLNYRSPVVTAQGRRLTSFNTDLAAKYTFLAQDRGTLTLRVSDVFNTLQFNFLAYAPGLDSQSYNKRESRVAFLNLSYRFGRDGEAAKSKRKEEKEDVGRGFE
ncbi:outer membrane beta-barrel family protein [Hymenobacter ginsengisoli]|uniref:Outer membrane beta-barrel family protein n=1 Tax=Hymenobacter ginsengisoli TaxID=1051626 RepID=A0ABP8Q570_9BACT|nr:MULTISPECIES: outer membrane beta-barrel protein [unclassified Hymenobacter]MBO2032443.1 TonB-dependent receptor [Hymenobacter sp. BT559]